MTEYEYDPVAIENWMAALPPARTLTPPPAILYGPARSFALSRSRSFTTTPGPRPARSSTPPPAMLCDRPPARSFALSRSKSLTTSPAPPPARSFALPRSRSFTPSPPTPPPARSSTPPPSMLYAPPPARSLAPPPPKLLRPLNNIIRGKSSKVADHSMSTSVPIAGIGGAAVTETSLAQRRELLRPPNGIVRGKSSNGSLATGVESRQSTRRAGTISRSASRRPQIEGPQSTGISKQGREPKLSAQSRAGRSGSIDDVPPPAYSSAVTPPISMAEEGPPTRTGRKKERISQASTIAPIRTHQPERLDSMQPPLGLTRSLSGDPFTPTQRSRNAAPARATQQSTSIPQEQEPSASSSASGMEGVPSLYKFHTNTDDLYCLPKLSISNITLSTDEVLDTSSFVSGPSFASTQTSIASYKTEKSINSRKSRYNALPRHKYADTPHLRPPRGFVSSDVDGSSVLETELRDGSDEATKVIKTTARDVVTGAYQSGLSTSITTERSVHRSEAKRLRFRLLTIGRPGIGKSSLITRVFGSGTTHVPKEADIQQEYMSPPNKFLVLHDSKGFESGDLSNFRIVREFVEQRSRPELPLSERIHGIWLCKETSTAGGRLFEMGDEELLRFAQKNRVPIVIVFIQYDKVVMTKRAELKEDHPFVEKDTIHSEEEAWKAFENCRRSLEHTMRRLAIPIPALARVSVSPNFHEEISELLQLTRNVVQERLEGNGWLLWAIAQRATLPGKINACVSEGISYYEWALASAPELGQVLLRDCLETVHKDIISGLDFKGEVLNSLEFQQLMLCLVQDVHTNVTVSPDVDTISQFVTLATATTAPVFPPVAILGTTFIFVHWLSTAVLENVPSVQRLLIAYTVDLICVLEELLNVALRPELAHTITWTELQEALVAYEQTFCRQRVHSSICSKIPVRGPTLTTDSISRMVRELLQESPQIDLSLLN